MQPGKTFVLFIPISSRPSTVPDTYVGSEEYLLNEEKKGTEKTCRFDCGNNATNFWEIAKEEK